MGGGSRAGDEGRAASRGGAPRTLIGGVGYHYLRDFSVGPWLVERLREERWPEGVAVEDLSYDPVKIAHRLAGEAPPFARLVVVGAARRGRRPGSVATYRWDGVLPDPERIQDRVSEAVTGVIDLDNLLVVLRAFGAAPGEVFVVEIEPEVEAMGEGLSPPVRRAAEKAGRIARRLAANGGASPPVPTAPLGGEGSSNGGGASPRITPFEPREAEDVRGEGGEEGREAGGGGGSR